VGVVVAPDTEPEVTVKPISAYWNTAPSACGPATQKALRVAEPELTELPTAKFPLHAPDDEAVKLPDARMVDPRPSVTRANGAPVTPDGSTHGETEESEITVPGGPDVGDAWKVSVWAHPGDAHAMVMAPVNAATLAILLRQVLIGPPLQRSSQTALSGWNETVSHPRAERHSQKARHATGVEGPKCNA
jgi:hypothetical protein